MSALQVMSITHHPIPLPDEPETSAVLFLKDIYHDSQTTSSA
jgi:hypothetical protein